MHVCVWVFVCVRRERETDREREKERERERETERDGKEEFFHEILLFIHPIQKILFKKRVTDCYPPILNL